MTPKPSCKSYDDNDIHPLFEKKERLMFLPLILSISELEMVGSAVTYAVK